MSSPIQELGVGSALRVVAPPLSRKTCAYCATRLDVHQAARGAACSAPACQKQHVLALAAQRRRTEVADTWRAASGFRARVAPALGVADPESLLLAIVPHFQRPVVKLPRARRAEFRAHLVRVVRQAFEEKLTEPDVSALAEELAQAVRPSAEIPEAGGACATCRGFCCRSGDTHAYLNATVVRSHLARHPGGALAGRRAVVSAAAARPVLCFLLRVSRPGRMRIAEGDAFQRLQPVSMRRPEGVV